MVRKAMIRASIPFVIEEPSFWDDITPRILVKGWTRHEVQGEWLLKHINTSFAKNIVCFEQQPDNMSFEIPTKEYLYFAKADQYRFVINRVQVYFFETGLGFCVFHIPYDSSADEEMIVNTNSILHCSVQHPDKRRGKVILHNGEETYLSCIAEKILDELLDVPYTLFGTQGDTALRRINLFSAVLCDKAPGDNAERAYNKLCYQLANAYDTRDAELAVNEQEIYHQHNYICWCCSKRGCAVVANQNGNAINDRFLEGAWFGSVKNNYFNLYLMVLHQKYASYNYLNDITEDPDMEHWKINQTTLTEFNRKYIFSIVSDEPFIQKVYELLKRAANAEEVYAELQEQLRRMFDYARIKSDEVNELTSNRLNLISVVVGAVCSISVIFDTIGLFADWGCCLGFQTVKDCIFTGVLLFEALLFITLLVLVIVVNKKPK